jgi:hypothetical protein
MSSTHNIARLAEMILAPDNSMARAAIGMVPLRFTRSELTMNIGIKKEL